MEDTQYKSDLFQEIIERMRSYTLSPEELGIIKDEAAWEQTKQNAMREGHEEGQRQTTLDIARVMLAKGIDSALIASVTGLTPAEIEQINPKHIERHHPMGTGTDLSEQANSFLS